MTTVAIRGLFRKEWLVSKNVFLFIMFVHLFVWITVLSWNLFYPKSTLLWGTTNLFISFHVLYLVCIVGSGLEMEARTQMWLHNPQSTSLKLAGKLLTGFYLQCINGIIAILLLIPTVFQAARGFISSSTIDVNAFSYIQSWIQIVVTSIELALYYMFYWIVYHALGKKYHSKTIRVFFLVLFICFSKLFLIIFENQILSGLRAILPIPMEMMVGMNLHISGKGMEITAKSDSFHWVGVILTVIKAIGLFCLSSWLLNKAVEAK